SARLDLSHGKNEIGYRPDPPWPRRQGRPIVLARAKRCAMGFELATESLWQQLAVCGGRDREREHSVGVREEGLTGQEFGRGLVGGRVSERTTSALEKC